MIRGSLAFVGLQQRLKRARGATRSSMSANWMARLCSCPAVSVQRELLWPETGMPRRRLRFEASLIWHHAPIGLGRGRTKRLGSFVGKSGGVGPRHKRRA